MKLATTFEHPRLADVPLGTLILFEYRAINYFALAVEPLCSGEPPALLCVYPKHPEVESAGILNGSVIGGGNTRVVSIPDAEATIDDLYAVFEARDWDYIAAGSLAFVGDQLALICYTDTRKKGAYAIKDGKYLGEPRPSAYFNTWRIELCDGQQRICLATIKARPRS